MAMRYTVEHARIVFRLLREEDPDANEGRDGTLLSALALGAPGNEILVLHLDQSDNALLAQALGLAGPLAWEAEALLGESDWERMRDELDGRQAAHLLIAGLEITTYDDGSLRLLCTGTLAYGGDDFTADVMLGPEGAAAVARQLRRVLGWVAGDPAGRFPQPTWVELN